MSTLTIPQGQIVELMVEVPQGDLLTYDLNRLVSALGVPATQIIVETDGGRHGLITIYPSNPLADVRAATRADLLMDKAGRIPVGVYHNGRLAKKRLFDPRTGSAQRFLIFGTTGAGKSRTVQLQIAAEKANGIVTWLADLKGGQSVPEALRCVDWPATTPEQAILMLRAGMDVIKERSERYSAMGRTAFRLGDPDPLLHIWIDEANRLLVKNSPYREEAAYRTSEIGRTGRSVGVGMGLAAQASHLDELGGSDTLRAMFKEGEITLLRWSSSMMQHLVTTDILPSGQRLMPIPKTLQETVLRSQFDTFDEDDEDDPVTAGTAYLLTGPNPTALMRHFRVGSIAPTPGLDPEILALYGTDAPARLETASHDAAGEAYKVRHDPDATAALCKAVAGEGESGAGQAAASTSASGGRTTRKAGRLADRILAVLDKAKEPMDADAILAAVNADGGREVKKGSVQNELTGLANNEDIDRAGGGRYAPIR